MDNINRVNGITKQVNKAVEESAEEELMNLMHKQMLEKNESDYHKKSNEDRRIDKVQKIKKLISINESKSIWNVGSSRLDDDLFINGGKSI